MATFREAVLAALAEGARLVEEATVSAALLETEIAKRESAESCERCGAYAAELDAWWTARNAERKADANG